ncbi:hypothetical protein [Arenibacter palladensis]|uniref:hypothetical protein n=1 Tax=Arenibacter palladensis TaxID=237373 RepID=UPI0026E483B6|nr:hypothetical protein [Arenibacter palladensis]MDO6602857.1 hypothetical protein [Arenibacter palladensis]
MKLRVAIRTSVIVLLLSTFADKKEVTFAKLTSISRSNNILLVAYKNDDNAMRPI